tara:strand:+ start:55 stop:315 length:261 start_codon:yes stop_codon:yes gene_type:complete
MSHKISAYKKALKELTFYNKKCSLIDVKINLINQKKRSQDVLKRLKRIDKIHELDLKKIKLKHKGLKIWDHFLNNPDNFGWQTELK